MNYLKVLAAAKAVLLLGNDHVRGLWHQVQVVVSVGELQPLVLQQQVREGRDALDRHGFRRVKSKQCIGNDTSEEQIWSTS
jgi:hypothetical protein